MIWARQHEHGVDTCEGESSPGDEWSLLADQDSLVLSDLRASKQAEIRMGYEISLAGVLAGEEASPMLVAVESAMLAVSDPDGLQFLVEMLADRRAALEQALADASAAEDALAAIRALAVSYPT